MASVTDEVMADTAEAGGDQAPPPPPPPPSPTPATEVLEERALVDLVRWGQVAAVYGQTGAAWVRDRWWVWVPAWRAYTAACWEAVYRPLYTQYALLNLRTRSYRYRTFVTLSLLLLIFFVFLDAVFFATRVDPPPALRQNFYRTSLVDRLSQQVAQRAPEVREERPLNQREDAQRHRNLVARTPGLGSHASPPGQALLDPNKPSSVANMLSKMVAKDVNMLDYFRRVLDKHDPHKVPAQNTVLHSRIGRLGVERPQEVSRTSEDAGGTAPQEESSTTSEVQGDQPAPSQQILQRAWKGSSGRTVGEAQEALVSGHQPQLADNTHARPTHHTPSKAPSGAQRVSFVDYENPYFLGDLGAAQMNLPHIHNMSEHLRHLEAFTAMLNTQRVSGDDPRLLQLVKNYWIRRPSPHPYTLKQPELVDFSMGQTAVVDEILNHKENGFFVECGALDGETRSNTLFFERERGWSGLLVEPGPVNYRRMVKKNRKAYLSPACLGVEPYPARKYFHRGKNRGRLLDADDSYQWVADQYMILDRTGVQCLPLHSLLLALNRTHVDYLSLDVEGVELEVLKSIPFHLLDIDVITVEFAHGRATKEELRDYVSNVLGYKVVWEVSRKDWLANDFVLVKESKIRR